MQFERTAYLFLNQVYPELVLSIQKWLNRGRTPLQIAEGAERVIGPEIGPLVEQAARHMLWGNYHVQ